MATLVSMQIRMAGEQLDKVCAQLVNCEPQQWNDSAALAFERQRTEVLALASELRAEIYAAAAEVA